MRKRESLSDRRRVMKGESLDPTLIAGPGQQDEYLARQIIDHSMTVDYIWQEYQPSLAAKATTPCNTERCGVCGGSGYD